MPSGHSLNLLRQIHAVSLVAMGLWLIDNMQLTELAKACRDENRWEFFFALSGLMTGLALSRAGVDVTMLERVDEFPRTGASLGAVDEGLLERITGRERSDKDSTAYGPSAPRVQTWTAVHARLRAAADADPHIDLRHNTSVQSVGQNAHSAWATTLDHQLFRGDVVIGADGHRSVVRRSVSHLRSPTRPSPATCSGSA
jgi:2-polyprenyl-6-methoxyphenol hydroxylase-like FAD-dependent oxidoreductase